MLSFMAPLLALALLAQTSHSLVVQPTPTQRRVPTSRAPPHSFSSTTSLSYALRNFDHYQWPVPSELPPPPEPEPSAALVASSAYQRPYAPNHQVAKADQTEEIDFVVDAINAARAERYGLPPLFANAALSQAAQLAFVNADTTSTQVPWTLGRRLKLSGYSTPGGEYYEDEDDGLEGCDTVHSEIYVRNEYASKLLPSLDQLVYSMLTEKQHVRDQLFSNAYEDVGVYLHVSTGTLVITLARMLGHELPPWHRMQRI